MEDNISLVKKQLSTVIDPDMEIDIVNLGLIYDVELNGTTCDVTMTMPTRSCRYGESIVQTVIKSVEALDFIDKCNLKMVWEPVWTKDRMTKIARLSLGV
ncbi:metal-sulfur cluster assembly factor [Companilactobacillus mishanensis]|uniref:Metal-sulfur cluster assembly factor n=1 Tax=Companilactobacillus mishanensis TaxID=2486008 RepID=A0A5P0ZFN3_9LACO|nr:metal-sulfur cluster assembly factor [Companilactobacillus mishanensis]MQS51853.1 metal-sulfur cluster assembly factor [Companilactobacillus mishanensis]